MNQDTRSEPPAPAVGAQVEREVRRLLARTVWNQQQGNHILSRKQWGKLAAQLQELCDELNAPPSVKGDQP